MSSADPINPDASITENTRHYRYYDMVMAGFVTVLLCSNLIGPGKSCLLVLPNWLPFVGGSPLTFGAGNIFFPISYIFGDILTEVSGYARARKVIWAGFIAMAFSALMGWVVIHLPVDPKEQYNAVIQPALETCFGNTWRIVVASMIAFWAGDFANSYVLAKMKVLTRGRFLWTRTIGSTIVGSGLDSLIFYPVALASWVPLLQKLGVSDSSVLATFGGWSADTLWRIVAFNWIFKTMIEVIATPVTYAVVAFLKQAEDEDYYDLHTDFTPFSLKD